MKLKLRLQIFAGSTSGNASHSEEHSSTVGGSTSHTTGHSETESHSYSQSHSVGGSESQSQGMSWASGKVEDKTQEYRDKYNTDYSEGQKVADTYQRLQDTIDGKPTFQSQYESRLDELYNSIMNREKFSYDFNADNMYQMYKDKYKQQGKTAMQDSMAQAAALNGGYGSSYAQSVGQQTYQNYMDRLNDVIPELRNQAYQEYQADKQDLLDKYNITNDAYNREYGQYRDAVSDWQSDRSFNYGMYSDERNFDYNQFVNDRNYWNQEYWNEKNQAQSNKQATSQQNWNDTVSQTDAYSQTNYEETTNSSYWSNTDSFANSASSAWSAPMGSIGGNNASSTQSKFKSMADEVAKIQENGKRAMDWAYQNDDQKIDNNTWGVKNNGNLMNMNTKDVSEMVSELKQAASKSEDTYLKLLNEISSAMNFSDEEIKAIMDKVKYRK